MAGCRISSMCFALTIAASTAAYAFEERGRVVGVSDGDTLTVLTGHHEELKVRVAGIDAPEKRQPFGEAAKKRMSALAYDRQAVLDCYKRDRFGRNVCRVFVDGADVGLKMVRDGFAWHYKRYQNEQTRSEAESYGRAEAAAKSARVGLWSDRSPVPPWDWRAGLRDASQPLELAR